MLVLPVFLNKDKMLITCKTFELKVISIALQIPSIIFGV